MTDFKQVSIPEQTLDFIYDDFASAFTWSVTVLDDINDFLRDIEGIAKQASGGAAPETRSELLKIARIAKLCKWHSDEALNYVQNASEKYKKDHEPIIMEAFYEASNAQSK